MRDIVLQGPRPRMASVSSPSPVLIRVGWHSPRSRAHRYQGGEAGDAVDTRGLKGVGQGHGGQNGGEAARQYRRARPRGAEEQEMRATGQVTGRRNTGLRLSFAACRQRRPPLPIQPRDRRFVATPTIPFCGGQHLSRPRSASVATITRSRRSDLSL